MDLELLREEILRTDMEIIDLISRRTDLAEQVGRKKIEDGLPIRNVAVEKKVVNRYRDAAESSGISPDTLEKIAKALIQEAVDREALVTPHNSVKKEISIIGGGGKMGMWMANTLSSDGHTIKLIDPSLHNGLTIEDASSSDVIIISIPMDVTEGVLEQLNDICRDDALIFDLTSLKTPISKILKSMAKRKKVCSLHPMFGPSARSMYGRNLIICDCGNADAIAEAQELFKNKGGDIRTMDIDDHDRYMSYVLGLSHAVNIAFFTVLDRSGISYQDMCTVASTTFRKNMETNESVALEDPKLYYEIQHSNAFRDKLWDDFSKAVKDIKDASIDNDSSEFIKIMDAGREYFSR